MKMFMVLSHHTWYDRLALLNFVRICMILGQTALLLKGQSIVCIKPSAIATPTTIIAIMYLRIHYHYCHCHCSLCSYYAAETPTGTISIHCHLALCVFACAFYPSSFALPFASHSVSVAALACACIHTSVAWKFHLAVGWNMLDKQYG